MRNKTKKSIALFLAAAVCAGLLIPSFLCVCGAARSRGDVDGNGVLTSADARLALRACVGLETYAPGSQAFAAADVDGDGVITSSDARRILRAAVGLEWLGQGASPDELKAAAMKAYCVEVKRIYKLNENGRNPDTVQFMLYDMDLNGMPELILDNGYKTNTGGGFGVYTFTQSQGLIHLGDMMTHGDTLFDPTPGDNSIRSYFAYHGYVGEFEYRVVNNKLVETTITEIHEEKYYGNESEYTLRMKQISKYVISGDGKWTSAKNADAFFNSASNR